MRCGTPLERRCFVAVVATSRSSGRSQEDPTRSVASTGAEEALATHLDFFGWRCVFGNFGRDLAGGLKGSGILVFHPFNISIADDLRPGRWRIPRRISMSHCKALRPPLLQEPQVGLGKLKAMEDQQGMSFQLQPLTRAS